MELNIDRSKWKKVRLGDVATAPSIRINNPSESEFDRFIGNANIGQWDFRLTRWEHTDSVTSAMKGFETGDYLFVRRSLYASDFRERSPRATFPGVCSGDIITIRENPEMIADGFLIGVLNHPAIWKFVVANASGSITRRIKWRDLANYEFLLPPKDQQAKLAELLWAADAVVENRNQVGSKLGNSLDAVFAEALNTSNSEAELKEFGEIVTGSTPSTKKAEFWDGSIPFITPGDIDRTPLVEDAARNITDLGLSNVREIAEGSIMVVSIGATIGKVGIAMTRSATNQQINTIIPHEADSRTFLFQALRYYKTRILARSSATTLPIINKGEFSKVRIPVPSVNGKDKFNNNFEKIDRVLQANEELAAASKQLLKSLINQIF